MKNVDYETGIGKNIKDVRIERKMSQQKLADACGFSNTVISGYETGRRIPGLSTLAIIARELHVSMERLYYGDDNNAFINATPDTGRKIVNAVYLLWEQDVFVYYENPIHGSPFELYDSRADGRNGLFMQIARYPVQIKRLLSGLNDFRNNQDTYKKPEEFLEMFLASVAEEINKEINKKNGDGK